MSKLTGHSGGILVIGESWWGTQLEGGQQKRGWKKDKDDGGDIGDRRPDRALQLYMLSFPNIELDGRPAQGDDTEEELVEKSGRKKRGGFWGKTRHQCLVDETLVRKEKGRKVEGRRQA